MCHCTQLRNGALGEAAVLWGSAPPAKSCLRKEVYDGGIRPQAGDPAWPQWDIQPSPPDILREAQPSSFSCRMAVPLCTAGPLGSRSPVKPRLVSKPQAPAAEQLPEAATGKSSAHLWFLPDPGWSSVREAEARGSGFRLPPISCEFFLGLQANLPFEQEKNNRPHT